MQLAALSCVLRQTNLREYLVWKLPEPHILRTNPPASGGRYEGSEGRKSQASVTKGGMQRQV